MCFQPKKKAFATIGGTKKVHYLDFVGSLESEVAINASQAHLKHHVFRWA